MQLHPDELLRLTERLLGCNLLLHGRQYGATASMTYSDVPVTKPTTRGGVYFADKMAFKIKAHTKDQSLIGVLSSAMLGPNSDFEKIEIRIDGSDLKIFAHLTNYVQKKDELELNLVVVGTELSN
ncbi:MAG: hypothetical protein QXE84_04000 [Candidatus Nitrosotenuis sp.]|uniref:Uncharacterized protein n=1 Tax=Candidatus Nitrosotenuis uzonensis TaxID=1407055 RepID=A0A812F2A0_9ARCH|nr:hypothetical protein [Candidatus Nitrosotenuis uzonensis]CAE6500528.1 conserved hypothetical protein [Candidatus Nitrosotenuis uzonensis]